jgi:hypothetical protein
MKKPYGKKIFARKRASLLVITYAHCLILMSYLISIDLLTFASYSREYEI